MRDARTQRETAGVVWFYAKSAMEELIEKTCEAGRCRCDISAERIE